MNVLNQIKTNLDNNKSLTEDVKAQVFELIAIFHKTFPEVSLDTLIERIKDLKVGKLSLYERRGPVVYDPIKNEILLNRRSLDDDYDINHLMMKGLLGCITAKDNFFGFNKNDSLYALNMGVTEMLANTLVGNDGKCDFEEELIATNIISKIIGRDLLFDAYFNNDAEIVYKKLLEAEGN